MPLKIAPRRGRALLLRVLSAAATMLLLVASVSLSAIAWTVTTTILEARGVRAAWASQPSQRHVVPRVRGLSAMGTATHDAGVLWRRAELAASRGRSLTLVRATVAEASLNTLSADRTSFALAPTAAPARHGRGSEGLEIQRLGSGSLAELLGMRRGDVLTAVNGFPMARADGVVQAIEELRSPRGAVVELWRGGRKVALRIQPTS